MKTLSYVLGRGSEIEIGGIYYFGQLWDGNGDGDELLESGAISPKNDEDIVGFEVVEHNEDVLKTQVKVTDIY